jgi:hypothetical protein
MADQSSARNFLSGKTGRWLLRGARLILGGLLIYAGYSKIRWAGQWHLADYKFIFAIVIDSYKMLPLWAVTWMAQLLPPLEIALGVFLILGVALRWAGTLTIALLGMFMVALVHAIALRLEICGCYGDKAVNPKTELLQDIGLMVLALFITTAAFLDRRPRRPVAA